MKLNIKFLPHISTISALVLFLSFFSFLFINFNQIKPAQAAASLTSPVGGATNVGTCSADGTKVTVTFNWTPQIQNVWFHLDGQWLDFSYDGGATWVLPGTNVTQFSDIDTYIGSWQTFNAQPKKTITWRINTLNGLNGLWDPSPSATFTTLACTPTGGGGGGGGSAECTDFRNCTDIPGTKPPGFGDTTFIVDLVSKFLPIALGMGGFLSVIIIVVSGLQFITSNGNPEGAAGARGRLIFALVGFVLLIIAYALTKVIDTIFLKSGAL